MFAWLRLAVIGLVFLTLVYWAVGWYLRSHERERREREFDAGGVSGDRRDYIEGQVEAYFARIRWRVIVGVYVVPFVAVLGLIYVMNYM